MSKEKQKERRRFEDKDRKPWKEEERKKFLDASEKLRPYIKHLTTPAREEKEESQDPLDAFLGIGKE